MITRPGASVLSNFKAQLLLSKLQKIDSSIQAVSANYVYFLECSKLSQKDGKKVDQLLKTEDIYTDDPFLTFTVTPRFGTISPWSSKATDIFKAVGLNTVTRIERGIHYRISLAKDGLKATNKHTIASVLYDPMTEVALPIELESELDNIFAKTDPRPMRLVSVIKNGTSALQSLNDELGLALTQEEIEYLVAAYCEIGRDPTDAEIMMFSLVNSEHCRHKVFNAEWAINGKAETKSLFSMIRNTYSHNSSGVKSAYKDNGAVLEGLRGDFFTPNTEGEYEHNLDQADIVVKVETHNHPTAIAPVPGAATGSGGEIRDEGATGRGAKPKAGLTGFSVSNLNIPGALLPWETTQRPAPHLASALDIMLEAPIGGAAFNNEFGRPNILGYFRSFEQEVDGIVRGYHKPIMLAGGVANIRPDNVNKKPIKPGDKIIILGGPAMLIGLGGGSASSKSIAAQNAELDFASVQRHNPEMQRRAQEVINSCVSSDNNPIVSIHDIGAGGYSNAVSEIVHDHGLGADVDMRAIHNADRSMSPMEIWSNEAQERYVIAIRPGDLGQFEKYCKRERCPYAVIGEATKLPHLRVRDSELKADVIDASMSTFFGKPPQMKRSFSESYTSLLPFEIKNIALDDAIYRVLAHPTVGSKSYLITIGDRSVGGMVTRDQMVGPWQVPVADVAVTTNSFDGYHGEAMAIGERTPLAIIDPASSGRMAIGELITNAVAADIGQLSDIKLSANWMAAVGTPGGDQALYETVKTVGMEFCPALGMTIPVGKDSTSMKVQWQEGDTHKEVISPLSLIVSGFAPVNDVRKTLTPQLLEVNDTILVAIPLSDKTRLGGSVLAHAFLRMGDECPDADASQLKLFFERFTKLKQDEVILAYHDRSDGGFLATLCEMAFASRTGLDVTVPTEDVISDLFNEELGAVVQVLKKNEKSVLSQFEGAYRIATTNDSDTINIWSAKKKTQLFSAPRADLQTRWTSTSYQLARLRDNPDTAQSEFDLIRADDPGLTPTKIVTPPKRVISLKHKPAVAILREQGVNGYVEMAAAFDRAGFRSVDVHMSDILGGTKHLKDFVGLAACGGFSYGDVLGAGNGWAKSILLNENARKQFSDFFRRPDTFSLGVCNGCQMLSLVKDIIPGADSWPRFVRNTSEQFEARLTTVQITRSPSVLLKGMEDLRLLVPTAHGEGRAEFRDNEISTNLVAMRYVDGHGKPTETYPYNPNGSQGGITALTSKDGRATVIMPHPERVFRNVQLSWRPQEWQSEDSPWMQMFDNAYKWSKK